MSEDIFCEGKGLENGVVWCLGRADVCKAASLCRHVLSRLPQLPQPEFVVGYHLCNMCEQDVHWVYTVYPLLGGSTFSFKFPRKACFSGFGDGKWQSQLAFT